MIAHVMTTDTARPGGVVRRPEHRPSFRLPSGTKSKPISIVCAAAVSPRRDRGATATLSKVPRPNRSWAVSARRTEAVLPCETSGCPRKRRLRSRLRSLISAPLEGRADRGADVPHGDTPCGWATGRHGGRQVQPCAARTQKRATGAPRAAARRRATTTNIVLEAAHDDD